MKRIIYIISVFLIFFHLISCKEVFYPDEIISNEQIPVIQGSIHSEMPPEVKLTWAIPYEEKQISYINGAQVWITDDLGAYEALENTAPGIYTPVNAGFTGVLGRTYTLHVEMPSGKVYESTPERISSKPEIDSLFAVPTKRTVTTLSSIGSSVTTIKEGLEINASLSKDTGATCFYRFETDYVAQTEYTLAPYSFNPIKVYEWNSYILDEVYSVDFSFSSSLQQVLPEHNAGFLEFIYNSFLSDEESTAPYTGTWVVTMHIYSISNLVYQYYHSILEQLNATNEIFAPVPSQIKCNVRCTNDDNEKVIGIFEAASETIIYMAFKWIDINKYKKQELDFYPEVGLGITYHVPPAFWIEL